jgi:5'-nucleotidase/UDP-sugar diphosphatase
MTANQKQVGGLSLLSSYITKVRKEEENVLYLIAGDMVQGSLIDSEYKGISTMEIMNYLAPDVAALGNHEFDYGLPHLALLWKKWPTSPSSMPISTSGSTTNA